jgi:pyrroline-5-carboxylate reductase
MSERTVGIVGGGRVARILLGGWQRAGRSLTRIVVSDIDRNALQLLHKEFPSISVAQDNQQSAAQDIVLFALHPPAFPGTLEEVKGSVTPDAIFVSLAPRWTMSQICAALGGFNHLARVIPNAPSIVNKGYNPVSFSNDLRPEARAEVLSLFAPLGTCPEVVEDTLEAYAILAAMGPTYLWYQLYQLTDLGCEFGLGREAAETAVAAMVSGAVATMTDSGMGGDAVMDLIPVKPLASLEPTVREAYASVLSGLHRKLKG